MARGRDDDTTE